MKTETALSYYKNSRRKVAEALGLSAQAVYLWGDLVPPISAMRLEVITRGKLRVDHKLYTARKTA